MTGRLTIKTAGKAQGEYLGEGGPVRQKLQKLIEESKEIKAPSQRFVLGFVAIYQTRYVNLTSLGLHYVGAFVREGMSGRKAERRGMSLDLIRKRFPSRSDVIAVLAIAVFVCFSWTIFGFFNKLSSFLLYFTLGEIAAVFAYMMAFALLESLAVTGILVLVSAILPSGWLKDGFGYKGFIILVIASVDAILLQNSLENVFPPVPTLALLALAPIVLSVAVILFIRSRPRVQNLLVSVQDRFLVMLVIYLPIGLISIVAVTFRNLL